jgi:hypothetical protein
MDHWGIYLQLNLQEHWCQNSWKSLLIIGPKMGAGPKEFDTNFKIGILDGGKSTFYWVGGSKHSNTLSHLNRHHHSG